jgi:integrase
MLRERTRAVQFRKVNLGALVQQFTPLRRLYEEWRAEHESSWSASHHRDVRIGVPSLLDELRANDVRDVNLRAVLTWRARRTDLAPRTRNKRLAHLRACIRWAVATQRIALDPLEGLAPLPVRDRDRRLTRHVLTQEEAAAFLAAARAWDAGKPADYPKLKPPPRAGEDPGQAILAEILYGTGMRPGEVYRLSWGDWNARTSTIRVAPSKNGDARVVPVGPGLAARLQETRERRGVLRGRDQAPIVVGVRWARYRSDAGAVGRIWEAWRKMAKLPEVWPEGSVFDRHAMRHTVAHRLKELGVPLPQAMQILGHRSSSMLLRVYGQAELTVDGSMMPRLPEETKQEEKKGEQG